MTVDCSDNISNRYSLLIHKKGRWLKKKKTNEISKRNMLKM